MHPSIALIAAEREMEEKEGIFRYDYPAPPPPFLHFAPRWHQRRRTMTGVMAGYFDHPPKNKPLPIIPGAHALLARTAAPAVTEEDLILLEKERKRFEALNLKRSKHAAAQHKKDDEGSMANMDQMVSRRSFDRSLSRSQSPMTETRHPSDDSTPPLTPMSSSALSLHDDGRLPPPERKKKLSASIPTRVSPTLSVAAELPPPNRATVSTPTAPSTTASALGEDREEVQPAPKKRGRKRKYAEAEMTGQRPRAERDTSEGALQRTKTRPGWKGWVEVEGSPEPKPSLINLDFPVATLETRTRSGKVKPGAPPPPLPRRRTKATTSRVKDTSLADTIAAPPAPVATPDPPLESIHTNSPPAENPAEV
ncbi:hypothetical protein FRB91_008669 [Serendipita sp. 411]|nr:hypothetical protein FRB91_008669 [Serendipita sp. 411]